MKDWSKKLMMAILAAVIILPCAAMAEKKAGMENCPQQTKKDGPGMMKSGEMEGMGMEREMMHFPRNLLDEIGVSADVKTKVDVLLDENEKLLVTKQAEVQVSHIDLRAEMKKDQIDIKKVQDLVDKISKIRGEMMKQGITTMASVLNLLTTDQKKKLEDLRGERMKMKMKDFKEMKKQK